MSWRACAVVLLSGLRTVRAEPCASLDGDAEAIAKVSAELVRLGVSVGAPHAGCHAVTAAVEIDRGGGIAVAVRDSSHRSEGRVVSDAALAAAWIDSWLHDDFEVQAPMMVQAPATPVAPPGDVQPAPARSMFERFALAVSYENAWTDTSSRWSGIGASACVAVGGFCFGGRARYLADTAPSNLTAATRTDTSVLATASWSQQLGNLSIAPEIGVGVGRMTTARVDGCTAPQACDPSDPTCMPLPPPPCKPQGGTLNQVYVGDNFTAASVTPRAQAALRIAIPIAPYVWLDGTAAITLQPFGHTTSYGTDVAPPPGTTAMDIALPGEPLASFSLGVGLRLGAR